MKLGHSCHFSKQTVAILSQSWHSIPRNLPRKKRNEGVGGEDRSLLFEKDIAK
ncbi:hypothetical protein BT93_E2404 [Corymbia citriodora subsp. variegata]|nr:hypothetical protein BT93_E2404 [Corymbia citriodora subsp. variegata]